MTQRRVATSLTVVGLLFAMAGTSRAVEQQQSNATLSASVLYSSWSWKFRIDPFAVHEFQLDVGFDASRAEYIGQIEYLNGFVEVAPPDTSRLQEGLLLDIHGIFPPPGQPPLGDVDIVDVWFQDLDPGSPIPPHQIPFRVFASEGDFIHGRDDVAQACMTYGPGRPDGPIIEAIGFAPGPPAPEPASLALCGTGLLALLGYYWRCRRRPR